jgi:hypothetical protein
MGVFAYGKMCGVFFIKMKCMFVYYDAMETHSVFVLSQSLLLGRVYAVPDILL